MVPALAFPMTILVTGSSGHLGEAIALTLAERGNPVAGVDILPRSHTTHIGSITDRAFVRESMRGVDVVYHCATLHKPHIATHSRQDFVDVNITGTLNLLEEAASAGVQAFVFTSSTSVFGHALRPSIDSPAAWITEETVPIPRNIYGVTKHAAEDLCEIFCRNRGLPCIVLRTSRFFPEADDNAAARRAFEDENLKVNEYLYRRVDIADVVSAHLLAAEKAAELGFRRYIISATTPFVESDATLLRRCAPEVVARRVPGYESAFAARGWTMMQEIDRVYVNSRARHELGWSPWTDFASLIERLRINADTQSELARRIGSRGYHTETFTDGPFPVE